MSAAFSSPSGLQLDLSRVNSSPAFPSLLSPNRSPTRTRVPSLALGELSARINRFSQAELNGEAGPDYEELQDALTSVRGIIPKSARGSYTSSSTASLNTRRSVAASELVLPIAPLPPASARASSSFSSPRASSNLKKDNKKDNKSDAASAESIQEHEKLFAQHFREVQRGLSDLKTARASVLGGPKGDEEEHHAADDKDKKHGEGSSLRRDSSFKSPRASKSSSMQARVDQRLSELQGDSFEFEKLELKCAQYEREEKERRLKQHAVDLVTENKKALARFKPEERALQLKERSLAHAERVQTAIEKKKAIEVADRIRVENAIQAKMEAKEKAERERREAAALAVKQEMQMKWLFILMIGSRATQWQDVIETGRRLRSIFQREDHAARVITRLIYGWVKRRQTARLVNAVKVFRRYIWLIRAFLVRSRRKRAVKRIETSLVELRDSTKFLRAIKRFKNNVVRAQRMGRRAADRRCSVMQIICLQWEKMETQVVEERRMAFMKKMDAMQADEDSKVSDNRKKVLEAKQKAEQVKKDREREKELGKELAKKAADAMNSRPASSSGLSRANSSIGFGMVDKAYTPRELVELKRTFLDIRLELVRKAVRDMHMNLSDEQDKYKRDYETWERAKAAQDMIRQAKSVFKGAEVEEEELLPPIRPFKHILLPKNVLAKLIDEGLKRTKEILDREYEKVLNEQLAEVEQMHRLQTFMLEKGQVELEAARELSGGILFDLLGRRKFAKFLTKRASSRNSVGSTY